MLNTNYMKQKLATYWDQNGMAWKHLLGADTPKAFFCTTPQKKNKLCKQFSTTVCYFGSTKKRPAQKEPPYRYLQKISNLQAPSSSLKKLSVLQYTYTGIYTQSKQVFLSWSPQIWHNASFWHSKQLSRFAHSDAPTKSLLSMNSIQTKAQCY